MNFGIQKTNRISSAKTRDSERDGGVDFKAVVDREEKFDEVYCGAYCLTTALYGLGQNADLQSILDQLGEPKPGRGYSLLNLKSVADRHNVNAKALKCSFSDLCELSGPFVCIAHVNGNHFVLLERIDATSVTVFDPPNRYEIKKNTFLDQWSGYTLILSPKLDLPVHAASGGHLYVAWPLFAAVLIIAAVIIFTLYRFGLKKSTLGTAASVAFAMILPWQVSGCSDATSGHANLESRPTDHVDDSSNRLFVREPIKRLGALKVSSQPELLKFEIVNNTAKDVLIKRISTSCQCFDARLENDVLKPGATTTLTTFLNRSSVSPEKNASIKLFTSDFDTPTLEVFAEWSVTSGIQAAKDRVVFEPADEEEKLTTSVELSFDSSVLIDVEKLVAASTTPDFMVKLDVSKKLAIVDSIGQPGRNVDVTGDLIVSDNSGNELLRVPMERHRVARPIEVLPNELYCGSDNLVLSQRFLVKTKDDLKSVTISQDGADIHCETSKRTESLYVVEASGFSPDLDLELEFRTGKRNNVFHHTVKIHTN